MFFLVYEETLSFSYCKWWSHSWWAFVSFLPNRSKCLLPKSKHLLFCISQTILLCWRWNLLIVCEGEIRLLLGSFHQRQGNISSYRLFSGPVPESRALRHAVCCAEIQTGIGKRRTELFVFLRTSGDSEAVYVLFPLPLYQSQNWKDFLYRSGVWERFSRERYNSVSEARQLDHWL